MDSIDVSDRVPWYRVLLPAHVWRHALGDHTHLLWLAHLIAAY